MKRSFSAIMALVLCLGCLVLPARAEEGLANFKPAARYVEGQFDDVGAGDWFHDNVAAVYELGLMVGNNGRFSPEGKVTYAEAVAMAARLNSIYATGAAEFAQGSPWYQVYVDYALEQGILTVNADGETETQDMEAPISRRMFALILSRALPAEALPPVNQVEDNAIPDVKLGDDRAEEIYRLYRAGVLTGGDERGTFSPEEDIWRSAAATVVTRMAYRSLRMRFTLVKPPYPDLAEQPRADDSLFANSAMVGNSLAQGMKIFSELSMNYFVYQSTTVFDPNGYDPERCYDRLLKGKYDRVYMEYGINEIGFGPEKVCAGYEKLIEEIRQRMPGVEIYVMALPPVTYQTATSGNRNGSVFTMVQIRELNAALREMCERNDCWYLDCCEGLCDETGYLPERYAGWDGSPHLDVSGYQAWAEIIRTHY